MKTPKTSLFITNVLFVSIMFSVKLYCLCFVLSEGYTIHFSKSENTLDIIMKAFITETSPCKSDPKFAPKT